MNFVIPQMKWKTYKIRQQLINIIQHLRMILYQKMFLQESTTFGKLIPVQIYWLMVILNLVTMETYVKGMVSLDEEEESCDRRRRTLMRHTLQHKCCLSVYGAFRLFFKWADSFAICSLFALDLCKDQTLDRQALASEVCYHVIESCNEGQTKL